MPDSSEGPILQTVAEAQNWNHHSQANVLLGFINSLIADDPEIGQRFARSAAPI